ncbi:MAG: hypothetical protein KatS3mg015_0556 [Fimbriimonadales bacterium]|nr:MAG: hypothetical protein KatS3mg015_0556 [Fimbriimonadales bacterium]
MLRFVPLRGRGARAFRHPVRLRGGGGSSLPTFIAFESTRDGNFEIYVMNADGTNQTNLTNNAAIDSGPVWSADGSKIAFVSDRDGNDEVYVMNADGTNQTRLTNNPAPSDRFPVWSPDGSKIAFVSDRDGNVEIYVMNADGTSQTRPDEQPGVRP